MHFSSRTHALCTARNRNSLSAVYTCRTRDIAGQTAYYWSVRGPRQATPSAGVSHLLPLSTVSTLPRAIDAYIAASYRDDCFVHARPVKKSVPPVAAVCDRRNFRRKQGIGAHRAPLQHIFQQRMSVRWARPHRLHSIQSAASSKARIPASTSIRTHPRLSGALKKRPLGPAGLQQPVFAFPRVV